MWHAIMDSGQLQLLRFKTKLRRRGLRCITRHEHRKFHSLTKCRTLQLFICPGSRLTASVSMYELRATDMTIITHESRIQGCIKAKANLASAVQADRRVGRNEVACVIRQRLHPWYLRSQCAWVTERAIHEWPRRRLYDSIPLIGIWFICAFA